jgi:[ribosomal protein S5]-alanine N-acetyltransferase
MSDGPLDLLESERLVYERLRPGHAEDHARLLRDPQVAATLWPWSGGPTEADAVESLRAKVEHWQTHGFGYWLLRDRATGELVGRAGLQHTLLDGEDAVEAGWAIVPHRWGQGLATEAAAMSVRIGFYHLALTEIVAFALPENLASRRVMEKSGFAYERQIVHATLPHVLYRIARPAFLF